MLSLLIHSALLLFSFFFRLGHIHPENRTIVNFTQIKLEEINDLSRAESTERNKKLNNQFTNKRVSSKQIRSKKEIKQKKEEVISDTTREEEKIFIPPSQISGSEAERLNFASSLLDSFLIRHPEYGEFMLKEKAKELVQNKNIIFSRAEIEKKINDELDEYLKKYYPEGSEHEINKYTGPGLQIPLDGFIESIKKIFQ